jgi:DNA-binding LacI/PurR family transcriptional regulator
MSVQLVSKRAGVSVATVSRVINHSRNVSPETVALVRDAMEKVGYVPPPVEKRQRRKRNELPGIQKGNIALLFPDTDNRALKTALSGRFMHGVGELLRSRGLNMIVTPLDAGFSMPPCVRDAQVDAVIVRGLASQAQVLPMLGTLPCVWLLDGDLPARGDQILEDNASVARLAVEHLARRGCRRVGVLNPMGLHYGYRSRSDWFGLVARREGLACDEFIHRDQPEVSLLANATWEPLLLELVDRVVTAPRRPDGLFLPFPDDLITFTYRALADRGVRLGVDIKVVCCSYDPPRLATLDRSITNIDILPEAMGRAAVETLLWRMRHLNEPQRRVMVMPALVEGQVGGK